MVGWMRKAVLAGALAVMAAQAGAVSVEEANELYISKDWDQAERAYRTLVDEDPDNALLKYRLAVSLRHQGDHDSALEWLEKARGGVVPVPYVELEKARNLVGKGDRQGGLAALNAAADAGFPNAALLEGDAVLIQLADDPKYAEAMEKMEKNRAPCEHMEEFSQFDFWLGEWRVVDPQGTFQGSNKIEKTQGGCLLVENWTGAAGTTGTSMNFYDGHAREWVQVWVSPGLQLEIRGGLVDGSMVLVGNAYYIQTGDYHPFRGTWTPMEGGIVRQHFEQSTDGGESWTTWFDGRYHPVTDEAE
jgi:predicted negative regulator of RcsB-dependent stress response